MKIRLGNAVACIADRDRYVFSGGKPVAGFRVFVAQLDVSGPEQQIAAVGHGVARVKGKIEHGRRELVRIDQGCRDLASRHEIDIDEPANRRL